MSGCDPRNCRGDRKFREPDPKIQVLRKCDLKNFEGDPKFSEGDRKFRRCDPSRRRRAPPPALRLPRPSARPQTPPKKAPHQRGFPKLIRQYTKQHILPIHPLICITKVIKCQAVKLHWSNVRHIIPLHLFRIYNNPFTS